MTKQKILLLGGSYGQIPAIYEAKKRGLYTILCDYLPDNPGRDLVDEFHLASTTDKKRILDIATEKAVDCILAYGSDPAVLTSAYVSEKLGFKGNSVASIELLTNKDLFRCFQKKNELIFPSFVVLKDTEQIPFERLNSLFPAIVKPVDASDTKGVTMVRDIAELEAAVKNAFNFSRCGRIIIEEKIGKEVAGLHGDGFVMDGELIFCQLGDHIFTSIADPLKPSSTLFPSRIDQNQVQKVVKEVADMIKKIGYKFGPVNIEARIDARNEIYIMEIGPRNGGNFIPKAIEYSTGFDMLKALFDFIQNEEIIIPNLHEKPTIIFTLHSNVEGIFDSFKIHNDLIPFLAEKYLFVNSGDSIQPYNRSGSSLGSLIFSFESRIEAEEHVQDLYHKVVDGICLRSE